MKGINYWKWCTWFNSETDKSFQKICIMVIVQLTIYPSDSSPLRASSRVNFVVMRQVLVLLRAYFEIFECRKMSLLLPLISASSAHFWNYLGLRTNQCHYPSLRGSHTWALPLWVKYFCFYFGQGFFWRFFTLATRKSLNNGWSNLNLRIGNSQGWFFNSAILCKTKLTRWSAQCL